MTETRLPDLAQVATAASLVVAFSFVVGLIFDLGFFQALGVGIFGIPMTLADHSLSAVFWLPLFGAASTIGMTTGFWTGVRLPKPPGPDGARRGRTYLLVTMGVAHLIVLVVFLFLLPDLYLVWIAFVLASMWGAYRLSKGPQQLHEWFGIVLSYVVILYVMGYGMGAYAVTQPVHEATISTAADRTRRVGVVRVFERGVMYVAEGRVGFASWDAVSRLQSRERAHTLSPALCRVVRCPPPI